MQKLCVWCLLVIAGCSERPVQETGTAQEALRVCATGATLEGVNVSRFQGTVDWAAVKAAGISFAFVTATVGTTADSAFATNWAGAANAGITRGASHFFRPALDATAQADFFLQTVGTLQPLDLPLVLHLEETDGLPASTVTQAALVFLERVQQATGRTPILFTGLSVSSSLGNPPGLAPYFLWIANYGGTCPDIPAPWNTWVFWQYSSTGTVSGITQDVYLDKFNGSLADLQQFLNPPADAGQPGLDAAMPELDAAMPELDAAMPGLDAAMPELDAAIPGLDAAIAGLDAAMPGLDAGLDAAMPGLDAAMPGVDAAMPGVDAAIPETDAGSTLDASQVISPDVGPVVTPEDASVRSDAAESPAPSQAGCSCGIVAESQSPWAVLLLALCALGAGHRRTRAPIG